MSHFTTLKTKFDNLELLLLALKDPQLASRFGYSPASVTTGSISVRGYGGSSASCEVRIPTSNSGYDLGFRKAGEAYELVADWYGIRDIKQQEFLDALSQQYSIHAVNKAVKKFTDEMPTSRRFHVVQEEEGANGEVRILLRRQV